MKNLISFITLLIFILSITDDVINTEAKEAVLDTDGEELRAGQNYIVRKFIWPGGDLSAYPVPNDTCAVSERRFGVGDPISFSPVFSGTGDVIYESTELFINFSEGILCGSSTVWKVVRDESTQKDFVVAGEVAQDATLGSWFRIEKFVSWAYKFVFCPKVLCLDVGLDGGRLALSDSPYVVVFFKHKAGGHNKY